MRSRVRRCWRSRRAWICASPILAVLGCTGVEGGADDTLLVAAASDLARAMPELVAAFEQEARLTIDATIGSSGQIAHQIANGAPVDVFLSADGEWVRRLGADERITVGSETVYARGALAVVSLPGSGPGIDELADLGRPSVRRIAIANPEHAPYGRAAREALVAAGLWDALEPRIVIGENVRQTIQYVESGAVDAAIGARALVREDAHRWVQVPAQLHDPLEQTLAVVAGRPREAEAQRFARFLLGPKGRAILARHGFDLPPPVAELTDEP